MPPHEIIFSPQAEKELKGLTGREQKLVIGALKKWKDGNLVPNLEKIKSQPDFYRFRASHLRIIYYPLNAGRVVLLLIRDRKDAYKCLGDLNDRLSTALMKIAAR